MIQLTHDLNLFQNIGPLQREMAKRRKMLVIMFGLGKAYSIMSSDSHKRREIKTQQAVKTPTNHYDERKEIGCFAHLCCFRGLFEFRM